MKVLKFGASLFSKESDMIKIKEVVESTEGDAIIVVPQEFQTAIRISSCPMAGSISCPE